jgi:hypothetical protein
MTSFGPHDCISHKFKPLVGSRPLHRFAVPLPRASREGGTYGEPGEKCECRSPCEEVGCRDAVTAAA